MDNKTTLQRWARRGAPLVVALALGAGVGAAVYAAVGGGSGTIKGGQHLAYANKPTMANLLVTLMDKMGAPVEKIGGSTGKLPLDTLSGI